MKRVVVLLLCALLLTGCSSPPSAQETDPIPVVPAPTNNSEIDTEQILAVSVPMTSKSFYADDGTELLIIRSQHMKLLLPNTAVANQIILDFLNRIDVIQRDSEDLFLTAQSAYHEDSLFDPYHQQLIYSPTRIDNGVLSLYGIESNYSGGMHGSQRAVSVNYDLRTGDILTFASIMHLNADKEDFIQLVLGNLQKNAEDFYLFDDFAETVRSRLGGDETQYLDFYFTQNSLVFYFSPYEIAPYASGVITAEIPYSQLTGLLYSGYFPDKKDMGTGMIQVSDMIDTNLEQFAYMEEVILADNGDLTVIYPSSPISDIAIIVSGDGKMRPSYTVFAAPEMNEKTAVILGLPQEDPGQIIIRYCSNGQQHELIL